MIKCVSCGRFISFKEIDEGKAYFYFEPDSHFGSEISEWTCEKCFEDEEDRFREMVDASY